MDFEYEMHDEDFLPKVIICGTTEENIPKLIVCNGFNFDKDYPCSGPCANGEQNQDHKVKDQQNVLAGINKQIQDLACKEHVIQKLQHQICTAECEIQHLICKNDLLNNQLQQGPDTKSQKILSDLENKFIECTENTTMLENKFQNLENCMKNLKDTLAVVKGKC